MLSTSPLHVYKLQEMHLTFRNHDATQPGEYTMEKEYTTTSKEAVIHFFFKRLSRENYAFIGTGAVIPWKTICYLCITLILL